jgi:hypothetical protein
MERHLALGIGPTDGSESIEVLREVFLEHRKRFGPDDWAVQYFEHGQDNRGEVLQMWYPVELPGLAEQERVRAITNG